MDRSGAGQHLVPIAPAQVQPLGQAGRIQQLYNHSQPSSARSEQLPSPFAALIDVDYKAIQAFGNWLDSGYEQVIPGTCEGDVERVPLSVVDLLQVGLVDD